MHCVGTDLLCLNRIINPRIPLEEFLKFMADLGIKYVKIRNDFTDKGILDGLSHAHQQKAFKDTGIKAIGEFIRTSGYRGWVVVEAKQDPAKAGPILYTEKAYHFIRKLIAVDFEER